MMYDEEDLRTVKKYNMKDGSIEELKRGNTLYELIQDGEFFNFSQNGLLYVTHVTPGYGEGDETYDMLSYEEQSGKLTVVEKGFRPLAMSPDKIAVFGFIRKTVSFQRYLTESKLLIPTVEEAQYRLFSKYQYVHNIAFLNNNFIFGPTSENESLRVFYDLDGKHIGDVFLFPEGKPGTIYDIGFSDR